MGFSHHRRFLTRVDDDNHPLHISLQIEGGDNHEDIPTLSARIEEKQKRVDTRPYQNNKIYPKTDELFPGEAEERQRQSNLQKKICILLCTVLPLVTTGATIHRLWFTGLLSFKARAEEKDCPSGWVKYTESCYLYSEATSSWQEALSFCNSLGSSLADVESLEEHKFIQHLITRDTWSGGHHDTDAGEWGWEGGAAWTWPGLELGSNKVGCLSISKDGNWVPTECNQKFSVLCERNLQSLPVTVSDDSDSSSQGRSGHEDQRRFDFN